MLRKWFVPALAVMAMALLFPADAQAQLGKGGGGKGGGKTEPPAKKEDPPKKGGDDKGGGKASPPTRGGSGNSGGSSGGGSSPPSKGGGGKVEPPPTRGGGSSNGGGRAEPPARGGNDDRRGGGDRGDDKRGGGDGQLGKGGGGNGGGSGNSGGGNRGGGGSGNSGGSGGVGGKGGGSAPPTRGGGGGRVEPPPTRSGGGNGQLGKGGSGGGSVGGGTRGGSDDRGLGGGRVLGPPDRIDQRDRGFGRNDVFNKSGQSRTGSPSYGSSRNEITRANSRLRIPDAPLIRGSNSGTRDVFREDRTVVHDRRYRSGYCHYSSRWVDDWFYYPHYYFDYYPGRCYPSPFYYYPHVPGYVASIRVVIGNFHFAITARERYDWRRPYHHYGGYDGYYGRGGYGGYDRYDRYRYDRYEYDLIDYQIDNLVTSFETGRIYYMQDMIPRSGFVHVALEEYSEYRMYSDDFYDMLADIVEGTDTRSYRVRDVRYDRNQYVIYAEHEYRDPWGGLDVKYHTIVMQRDREGYEIAYFRVDRRPNW